MADGETGAATGDRTAGPDARELTREELRKTFEYQGQRLREIDGKAIEILRANLLLTGIVVTGGSILVQTEFGIGPFLILPVIKPRTNFDPPGVEYLHEFMTGSINPLTIFGSFLLLVSTGLAAVTYTASNLRGGLDTAAVEAALERGSGTGGVPSGKAKTANPSRTGSCAATPSGSSTTPASRRSTTSS